MENKVKRKGENEETGESRERGRRGDGERKMGSWRGKKGRGENTA